MVIQNYAGEISWDSDSAWSEGDESSSVHGERRLSSFAVYDELVLQLARPEAHPALREIAIIGHSSGGEFVHRYSLTGRAEAIISATSYAARSRPSGPKMSYYPANPSSFTYLDARRPELARLEDVTCQSYCPKAWGEFAFVEPSAAKLAGCASYDAWKWGLEGDLNSYANTTGRATMREWYGGRHVTYLSGANDTCNLDLNDALGCRADISGCNEDTESAEYTCEFYAQGYCHYGRAMAYYQYIDLYYAGEHNHSMLVVPRVGHDNCMMFQSPRVRGKLFSTICESPFD